jgi:ABC-type polysaccharide/polyol phosphate export permease
MQLFEKTFDLLAILIIVGTLVNNTFLSAIEDVMKIIATNKTLLNTIIISLFSLH